MSYIKFSLTNVARMDTLAATAPGPGGAGNHPLPQTAGFYLIRNETSNNRYVGKSGDLRGRFDGRMLVINEFGLRTADLANIDVFWGQASAFNTPPAAAAGPVAMGPMALPPLVGGAPAPAPAMPAGAGAAVGLNGFGPAPARPAAELPALACPAPNYAAAQVLTNVDGSVINVEALLIRFWHEVGVGGFMTNLQHIGPFHNPTPHRMDILVEWGAGVSTAIPAAHHELQLNAGFSF